MADSPRTLYVSDLDGTLLDGSGRLSDHARAELPRLLRAGLPFTVASARSVVTMQYLLEGLPLELPVINFNGAFLSDFATGRHRFVRAMERAVIEQVAARSARAGVPPIVSTYNGTADRVYYTDLVNPSMENYVAERTAAGDPRLQRIERLDGELEEQVICLTIVDRRDVLEELEAWVEATFPGALRTVIFEDLYTEGDWHWLTVHHRDATKAHALRELAAELRVDLANVVVFGDDLNDLPLFEVAGHAVAVENARPAVRQAADEVIGPNTEDAVVRYLAERV
jgi:hypothetical protein